MLNQRKSEGVNVDPKYADKDDKKWKRNDQFFFNFERDHPSDFIKLLPQKYNTRLSINHGINTYYAYALSKGIESNRDGANWTRHGIKYGRKPFSPSDLFPPEYLDEMIEIALDRFEEYVRPLSEFGTFISLPSRSDLNKLIMDAMKKRVGDGVNFLTAPMVKDAYKNLQYHKDAVNRMTPEGKDRLIKTFAGLRKREGNVEIKNIPDSLRRYAFGFMKLNDKIETIKNHDILLVDDTIGSGASLVEALRLLKPFYKKELWFFAFLKDY